MKRIFICTSLFVFAFFAQAQKLDVGVNLNTGLPLGDYIFNDAGDSQSTTPGMAFGGSLEANLWLADQFSLGLELGFLSFGSNDREVVMFNIPFTYKNPATAIPISVKGTYYFMNDELKPYVGMGVGYLIMNRTWDVSNAFFGNIKMEWPQNGLFISPRAGVQYELSRELSLNFSVVYNMAFNGVDGSIDVKVDGQDETWTEIKIDPTNFLGINLGVVYLLKSR